MRLRLVNVGGVWINPHLVTHVREARPTLISRGGAQVFVVGSEDGTGILVRVSLAECVRLLTEGGDGADGA